MTTTHLTTRITLIIEGFEKIDVLEFVRPSFYFSRVDENKDKLLHTSVTLRIFDNYEIYQKLLTSIENKNIFDKICVEELCDGDVYTWIFSNARLVEVSFEPNNIRMYERNITNIDFTFDKMITMKGQKNE